MKRVVTVFWLASTFAISGIAVAGGAHATPPPPPTFCDYALSVPEVVQVSGASMVTATLTPVQCGAPFRPYASVVCIQGAEAATQCTQARESATAQVFMPYHPGATYTSSGRGLGTVFNDMSEPNWQIVGPLTAVL
jgi:hypothetical protein